MITAAKELQQLMSSSRRAMQHYSMIREGDRVAVGVSGGKDSLSLLCVLAEMRKFYPEKYELSAVSVNVGFPEPVSFDEVEDQLIGLLSGEEDPTFSIYSDQSVPVGEVVQMMNIAKRNHYKVILATQAE